MALELSQRKGSMRSWLEKTHMAPPEARITLMRAARLSVRRPKPGTATTTPRSCEPPVVRLSEREREGERERERVERECGAALRQRRGYFTGWSMVHALWCEVME
jgi:hypothetical protein